MQVPGKHELLLSRTERALVVIVNSAPLGGWMGFGPFICIHSYIDLLLGPLVIFAIPQ